MLRAHLAKPANQVKYGRSPSRYSPWCRFLCAHPASTTYAKKKRRSRLHHQNSSYPGGFPLISITRRAQPLLSVELQPGLHLT
jgi:hypothetical protein